MARGTLYASYLKNALQDEQKPPNERLQEYEKDILELAKAFRLEGQICVDLYRVQIHTVMGICERISTSMYWDKAYENFIWLVSRTLGFPCAVIIGCAIKQREFRFKFADQARVFSFLVNEKESFYCDSLDQVARYSRQGTFRLSQLSMCSGHSPTQVA